MNMDPKEISQKVASHLLEVEAIKLSPSKPFTWSSGWKSPIYCDNRVALAYPAVRTYIKEALAAMIKANYPEVEAIAGVATAGIPQGALVADALGVPFMYVRSKPKGHGMENLIEGDPKGGQKVVVLEDLVSTGGSSLKAVDALRQAGIQVLGMAAIFTYGFQIADDNFAASNVDLSVLSNYADMIDTALASGYVKEGEVEVLKAWRVDPSNWGG
ncbi:orotate phosphoribosyltransferase [Persicobacter diffluens]|uniref:Orotate phosphoribosyltransferase n=2 Tax=Persicobacter TaxID=59740 RepID=A0AAN5AKP0_9BACT|nr:orotate phosphoribosyltransferase [Persicobacter diffluens]